MTEYDRSELKSLASIQGSSEYHAALDFLYDRINYERMARGASKYPFRLKRMTQLMRNLGLADYLWADSTTPKRPVIHVAGTKGKGSTCAMVASMLASAGMKVGLYTSPHLHALEERFQINQQPCSPTEFVNLVAQVKEAIVELESLDDSDSIGSPSFFELTTAIAMLHFEWSKCDAVVLEVGLGGRLDSTNVFAPTICGITSIGLDHQHVLGDTLEQIAAEKAGIIKGPAPVVSGVTDDVSASVIRNKANEFDAKLIELGRDFEFVFRSLPEWGGLVDFRMNAVAAAAPGDGRQLTATLGLEGEHQAKNASLALAICMLLSERGFKVEDSAMDAGLKTVSCPARIERFELPDGVTVIIDAAHNDDSIRALCDCMKQRFSGRKITTVFGTSTDKSAERMLESLTEISNGLVLTQFRGNPRFLPTEELQIHVAELDSGKSLVEKDPIAACQAAISESRSGGVVLVCGSFFLASETRIWISEQVANDESSR